MAALPRLLALPLPYSVSAAVPALELSIGEDANSAPTSVTFWAYHLNGSESRARLVFELGLWATLSPSHSDREVVPEANYDWSNVSDYVGNRDLWREQWLSTGVCPDPNAYEVLGSRLLAEHDHPVGLRGKRLHHYLVLGHDAYVEVLAADWYTDEISDRKVFDPQS